MKVTDVVFAFGHDNVLSTNRTTLEITKESHLTEKGDCIVAVSADKAIADLDSKFKEALRKDDSELAILIEAGNTFDAIKAHGNSKLILTHPTNIVVRKSSFICSRTLAIQADKAACDLSRGLVEKLKNPKQKVKITFTVMV